MTKRNSLADLIAGWFGCGLVPVAPGTAGSLAALVLAWAPVHFWNWPVWWSAVAAVALIPPGIWAATQAAAARGKKDPRFVVVDEVIGQWIALAAGLAPSWKAWIAGFLLFRLFDIWKPPPVRQLEALPRGTGIVMDDVMAGVYAALVLFLARCFNLL